MLLWFVGPSVLIVWAVFRSPTADYRLVAAGALLPLLELPFGGARLLHSVVAPTVAMVSVMVVFRGRRIVQRRLLGLPIGMFLHLVLDAAWADQQAFWWPFLGTAWSPDGLPELNRGWLTVVLEVAGAGACWWAWRRFRLDEPGRRDELLRTGRLGRDIVPGA